jgi:hypothetical protein
MCETLFCKVPSCNSQELSMRLYNGQQFCIGHYKEIFLAELISLFEEWAETSEPPDRLKYLIGRFYSENETAFLGKPSLTKVIVHERSYGWKKGKDYVVFTVVRNPVDQRLGYPYCFEDHQTWSFSMSGFTFTFLSSERK